MTKTRLPRSRATRFETDSRLPASSMRKLVMRSAWPRTASPRFRRPNLARMSGVIFERATRPTSDESWLKTPEPPRPTNHRQPQAARPRPLWPRQRRRPTRRRPGYDRDRLRDYVAAFVLAGLDPQVGAEAEFFADRVDYFGEHKVTREKIRRDLQRYDNRWPERRFWLAGELVVRPIKDRLEVLFPLRYELRSGSRRSSGQVWKTLVLERTGADDLQIVAVNERKAR